MLVGCVSECVSRCVFFPFFLSVDSDTNLDVLARRHRAQLSQPLCFFFFFVFLAFVWFNSSEHLPQKLERIKAQHLHAVLRT